jgi:hypothetical protein
VAHALLKKVNSMNLQTVLRVVIPVSIFASLEKATSASLVFVAILFALLYFAKGKLPEP